MGRAGDRREGPERDRLVATGKDRPPLGGADLAGFDASQPLDVRGRDGEDVGARAHEERPDPGGGRGALQNERRPLSGSPVDVHASADPLQGGANHVEAYTASGYLGRLATGGEPTGEEGADDFTLVAGNFQATFLEPSADRVDVQASPVVGDAHRESATDE